MTVSAALKFVQGAHVGVPGQALFGDLVSGACVMSNGDNTGVKNWTFIFVDTPPGSAVPVGVFQDGSAQTASFTPDVPGGYHALIRALGFDGSIAEDERVFGVKSAGPTGLFMPPFKATDSMLNFAGGLRGWSPFMEQYFGLIGALDQQTWRANTNHPIDSPTDELTTANATPTMLTKVSLSTASSAADVFGTVLDMNLGAPDVFRVDIAATYYRVGEGPVLVGAITKSNQRNTAGAAAWDANLVSNGNDIEMRVTGAAATTIKWSGAMKSMRRK